MTAPLQLTVQHDMLYLNGQLLIKVYPAGDCDTCPWPMPGGGKYRRRLASALFDARECFDGVPHFDTVLLPDGTSFAFDPWVD